MGGGGALEIHYLTCAVDWDTAASNGSVTHGQKRSQ